MASYHNDTFIRSKVKWQKALKEMPVTLKGGFWGN